ncbi:MAG: hypothetical protein NVS2B14_20580 [Chamaesiphon sp.]
MSQVPKMEDWSKDFLEILDTVVLIVDEFFEGIAEAVEVVTEQMQNTVVTELDQYLHELFEPIVEIYSELEDVGSEIDPSITYIVQPTLEKNPACIGCIHYHGQIYGGNLLICAMHPYGWEAPRFHREPALFLVDKYYEY